MAVTFPQLNMEHPMLLNLSIISSAFERGIPKYSHRQSIHINSCAPRFTIFL